MSKQPFLLSNVSILEIDLHSKALLTRIKHHSSIVMLQDSLGTQLIVPVEGGLIELFRSKHVSLIFFVKRIKFIYIFSVNFNIINMCIIYIQVPNDQRTIETLISRLGVIVEHEFHENDMKSRVNSYHFHQIVPKLELLFPVQQPVMSSGATHFSNFSDYPNLKSIQFQINGVNQPLLIGHFGNFRQW